MNRELMLAVLSMDTYNRGYSPGLAVGGNQIGNATITNVTSATDTDAVQAGFAATAYSWNGEKVISFRGTDNLTGGDFWYGYGTGAGNTSTQAELAAQFYKTVNASAGTMSVTLTGHSLGGGLAGLLGSLYGQQAVVFDNMAYQAATNYIYWNATNPYINGEVNPNYVRVIQKFYPGGYVPVPNSSGVSGYQLNGQILQGWQSTGTVVGGGYSWGLSGLGLHSISLLVISMFAEQQVGNHDWWSLSTLIGPKLSSSFVAANVGISNGDNMQTMIAYSVVNEGVRPFGDAAIHSLFDDANQAAAWFASSNGSLVAANQFDLARAKDAIADMIVQYAAVEASNAVRLVDQDGFAGMGIVATQNGDMLISIEKEAAAWHGISTIVGTETFFGLARYLATSGTGAFSDEAEAILQQVDFIQLGNGGETLVDLATNPLINGDRLFDPATAGALVIGTTGEDQVTGGAGNDVIITGAGVDSLIGGEGNDALFAGLEGEEDADILSGEAGNDLLYAGGGADTLVGGDGKA